MSLTAVALRVLQLGAVSHASMVEGVDAVDVEDAEDVGRVVVKVAQLEESRDPKNLRPISTLKWTTTSVAEAATPELPLSKATARRKPSLRLRLRLRLRRTTTTSTWLCEREKDLRSATRSGNVLLTVGHDRSRQENGAKYGYDVDYRVEYDYDWP